MGQELEQCGGRRETVCAACVRVEGRKKGRKGGYLRRPQRASSHLAKTRGHSRGHRWRSVGQPPGASCHPSHRAEPSDPIYQEGNTKKKKKKRLTVVMKDEVSKARPPAYTDSHQNQLRPRNLWQLWWWGWWHPTAEDRRPSDDFVWPRPRRHRARKWCHPVLPLEFSAGRPWKIRVVWRYIIVLLLFGFSFPISEMQRNDTMYVKWLPSTSRTRSSYPVEKTLPSGMDASPETRLVCPWPASGLSVPVESHESTRPSADPTKNDSDAVVEIAAAVTAF